METYTKEDFNNEPVFYCTKCLSLKIRFLEDMGDFCDKCGSTNISQSSIEDWEILYENKYGKKFINTK